MSSASVRRSQVNARRFSVPDVEKVRLIGLLAGALGAMVFAPAVATALAVFEARLDGLRRLSITDPIVWWGAVTSLLSSSMLAPPAYISLLGLVPHVLYLAGLVILASTLAALARSWGRTWRPFTVGALAATVSVLTAAPSWFWGITGLFFSVPPAIIEVLVVGFLCSRVAPMVYRSLMRQP